LIPITPVAPLPIGRKVSSLAENLSDIPIFETSNNSSFSLTKVAETTSSFAFSETAIKPPLLGESYSGSGVFLTMPALVAITK
jgi:hypothetical protein